MAHSSLCLSENAAACWPILWGSRRDASGMHPLAPMVPKLWSNHHASVLVDVPFLAKKKSFGPVARVAPHRHHPIHPIHPVVTIGQINGFKGRTSDAGIFSDGSACLRDPKKAKNPMIWIRKFVP